MDARHSRMMTVAGFAGALIGAALTSAFLRIMAPKADALTQVVERLGAIESRLPPKAPSFDGDRLLRLEANAYDQAKWPVNADAAKSLASELNAFRRETPPSLEDDLLPRLVPLQWALKAHLVRHDQPTNALSAAKEDERHERLLSAESEAPDEDVAVDRLKPLRDELETLVRQARDRVRNAAKAEAKALLAQPGPEQGKSNDRAVAALESLLRRHSGSDGEASTLLVKIEELATLGAMANQVSNLDQQITRYGAAKDPRVKQAGIAQIYEKSLLTTVGAVGEGIDPARVKGLSELVGRCETELGKIADAARQAERDALSNYQKWALEQIQLSEERNYDFAVKTFGEMFEQFKNPMIAYPMPPCLADYNEARELLAEMTKVPLPDGKPINVEAQKQIYLKVAAKVSGWRGHDTALAYRVVREATVKHLLPIDTRLLDPPVMQLYQRAFDTAWKKLEDRKSDQLELAKAAATVVKAEPGKLKDKKEPGKAKE